MNNIESLEKAINSELASKIISSKIKHNQIYVTIEDSNLSEVMIFLKNNSLTKFRQLIDITAVDYPEKDRRFKMVYLLLSHETNSRILIDCEIKEGEIVPSLTSIFPAANWMEREVFDMYGIEFKDHPDLRRILTDYGFEGHPLRKDFPLTGFKEVRYDIDKKKEIINLNRYRCIVIYRNPFSDNIDDKTTLLFPNILVYVGSDIPAGTR